MKKQLTFTLALLATVCNCVFAQSPDFIPYQAAVRNSNGDVLVNQQVSIRFTIHQDNPIGQVIWQEQQSLISNSIGIVNTNLGVSSSLTLVDWSEGNKFLQVELDINGGTNFTDLGSTQMMSVPFALHANCCELNVSLVGDTLYSGCGNFVIIPGISAVNNLPGVNCPDGTFFNQETNYSSVNDIDGNSYKTVQIGNQNWFAENLRTTRYTNGDVIEQLEASEQWSITSSGAWTYHSSSEANNCPFGKLYNWYVASDSRNVCPVGWHVPTDAEWIELSDYLGGDEVSGGKLKSAGLDYWYAPNQGGTNEVGFSALGGGQRVTDGTYYGILGQGYWWTSSEDLSLGWGLHREMRHFDTVNLRAESPKTFGYTIRCIQD
jgi:uncharacterized protein (TIGR02145 family)